MSKTDMSKTVLITGASSGFGHATASHFAEQGWNVVATMRAPSDTALSQRDNVLITKLDVTEPDSIDAAIGLGVARFGKIDAVVNNAGYGQYGVFEGIAAERIQHNFDVNFFGVMNVMRAVLPSFRQQGHGLIVNVSSVGGLIGLPAASIYLSTKFALEGFTESVAYELAAQNIIVKLVEPGGGKTGFHARAAEEDRGAGGIAAYEPFIARTNAVMSELGTRMATPEKIAGVIYAAATDGTSRLRYLAGDDVKHFVDARRSMDDESYENYMREQLA